MNDKQKNAIIATVYSQKTNNTYLLAFECGMEETWAIWLTPYRKDPGFKDIPMSARHKIKQFMARVEAKAFTLCPSGFQVTDIRVVPLWRRWEFERGPLHDSN